MNAAVVLMEDEPSVKSGRRCRILGKAGKYIGGSTIDQWLFQEVLRQNEKHEYDELIRFLSNALLIACEKAKEELSSADSTSIHVNDPMSGSSLTAFLTRQQLENILDQHDLFRDINQILRSALNGARERGYDDDQIQAVLMVGGSSAIPSVQRSLRHIFGKERVQYHRPFDAVARGVAAFVAGVDFYDHIQHDYAIRFVDPSTHQYNYRVIIQHGTPYPTQQPVARLSIKASYDGQTQLGIAVFELAESRRISSPEIEIVFDQNGAARVVQVSPGEIEQRTMFWMNESNPTFLRSDPPALRGETRFEVEFGVDANKRLTITSRDLRNGNLTHKDHPVVKLI